MLMKKSIGIFTAFQSLNALNVLQWGFADGVDVEADFVERGVVEMVAAVEQKGRLNHAVEDFLIIEGFVFVPLG